MSDIPRLVCDEDDFALSDICYSLSVCDQTEEECGQDTCQSGTKVHRQSPAIAHHMTDKTQIYS